MRFGGCMVLFVHDWGALVLFWGGIMVNGFFSFFGYNEIRSISRRYALLECILVSGWHYFHAFLILRGRIISKYIICMLSTMDYKKAYSMHYILIAGVCSFSWNLDVFHVNSKKLATESEVWIGNFNVKLPSYRAQNLALPKTLQNFRKTSTPQKGNQLPHVNKVSPYCSRPLDLQSIPELIVHIRSILNYARIKLRKTR